MLLHTELLCGYRPVARETRAGTQIGVVVIHRLKSERWQYLYHVAFVIPMVIPQLVGLLVWKSFYNPTVGILNKLLQTTGIMDVLAKLDNNWLHWQAFTYGQPAWLANAKSKWPTPSAYRSH